MKTFVLVLAFSISIGILSSCSSRRSSSSSDNSKRKGITGLKPTTGRPSAAVINASGDGMTPGINPLNRTTGSSKEQATAIANDAISKASAVAMSPMPRLDTLTGTELTSRLSASNTRQIKITVQAQKEAESKKIRDYASMIIKDHQQLQTDLDKLSSGSGTNDEALIVTRLRAVDPASQHRNTNEFIQMTIEDHQNMIRLLEAGSRSANPALKGFAVKYLPMLKKHLSAAQDLTLN